MDFGFESEETEKKKKKKEKKIWRRKGRFARDCYAQASKPAAKNKQGGILLAPNNHSPCLE